MPRVLCVGKRNTARSPMMAALLKKELGGDCPVESAGIQKEAAGQNVDVHAIVCMRECDIDLSGHRSRWIDSLNITSFTHIVCTDEAAAEYVVLSLVGYQMIEIILANENSGGIPLPRGAGLTEYRECVALLERTLPAIARQIRYG